MKLFTVARNVFVVSSEFDAAVAAHHSSSESSSAIAVSGSLKVSSSGFKILTRKIHPAEAGIRPCRIGCKFGFSPPGGVQIVQHQASFPNLVFQIRNLSSVGVVRLACRGLECQNGTIIVFAGKVNQRVTRI